MSVKQDLSASRKDCHNNKLSHNSEENSRQGHNHWGVRCLGKGTALV